MLTSEYNFSEKNCLQTLNYNLQAFWVIKANSPPEVHTSWLQQHHNVTKESKQKQQSKSISAPVSLGKLNNIMVLSKPGANLIKDSSGVCCKFIAVTIQGHF